MFVFDSSFLFNSMRTDKFFCPSVIFPMSQTCVSIHIPAIYIYIQEDKKNRGR